MRPKQLAHSSSAMYLSWSASHCSKKLVVQCSIGIRGARRGASSVWDRNLKTHVTVKHSQWKRQPHFLSVAVSRKARNKSQQLQRTVCSIGSNRCALEQTRKQLQHKLTSFTSCKRTRPRGAGRAGRTASAQGRCTCCSSSRSPGPAGPESGHQPAVSSHSRRSSSPEQGTHLFQSTEVASVLQC